MVAGAAIGHDWPAVAVNLRVIALIFLRLIRTIVAPLLFATLVSGIAGHADLKKVGRMGVKAIVYFEVVTTVALVIGLVAINLSKAGVGAQLPTSSGEALQTQKLTAGETILHIFPENFAKSVAEGQILQIVVFSILFGIALAGASLVRGLQEHGMVATGKHFPGHGDTDENSHLTITTVHASRPRNGKPFRLTWSAERSGGRAEGLPAF